MPISIAKKRAMKWNYRKLASSWQQPRNAKKGVVPVLLIGHSVAFVVMLDQLTLRVLVFYEVQPSSSLPLQCATAPTWQVVNLSTNRAERLLGHQYSLGPPRDLLELSVPLLQQRKQFNIRMINSFAAWFKMRNGRCPTPRDCPRSLSLVKSCNIKIDEAIDVLTKFPVVNVFDMASMSDYAVDQFDYRVHKWEREHKAKFRKRYAAKLFVRIRVLQIEEYTEMFGEYYSWSARIRMKSYNKVRLPVSLFNTAVEQVMLSISDKEERHCAVVDFRRLFSAASFTFTETHPIFGAPPRSQKRAFIGPELSPLVDVAKPAQHSTTPPPDS